MLFANAVFSVFILCYANYDSSIMFFQIRVFRKLSRYGLVRVINYAHFFFRGQKIYVLTQDGKKL